MIYPPFLRNIHITFFMTKAITDIKLDNVFPEMPEFVPGIRRAPSRGFHLTKAQTAVALKNALRYLPKELHEDPGHYQADL